MSETSRNGEPVFPRRTAGNFPDDTNPQYWVQTLNDVQKGKAESESLWAASETVRPYRRGGKKHASITSQIRELDADGQAVYLSAYDLFMGKFQREAAEKYAMPEAPQRKPEDEQNDIQWMEAGDKWREEQKKVDDKRKKEIDKLFEARKASALKLTPQARFKECVEAAIQKEFAEAYIETLRYETLLRAVRVFDEHSERQFSRVEEIEDLPDAGAALWEFYNGLDPVMPSEIPTSPDSLSE